MQKEGILLSGVEEEWRFKGHSRVEVAQSIHCKAEFQNKETSMSSKRLRGAPSMLLQQILSWPERLVATDPDLSGRAKSTLKKISLAAAFAMNLSFNSPI